MEKDLRLAFNREGHRGVVSTESAAVGARQGTMLD